MSLNVSAAEASDFLDLGSDHRAVFACISIPAEHIGQYAPRRRMRVEWRVFEERAENCHEITDVTGLSALEQKLGHIAKRCSKKVATPEENACDSDELKELRQQRRSATGAERANLSKMI